MASESEALADLPQASLPVHPNLLSDLPPFILANQGSRQPQQPISLSLVAFGWVPWGPILCSDLHGKEGKLPHLARQMHADSYRL